MESVPVHEEAGVLFWVRNRTYPPFLGQKGNVSGYPPFLGKNYNVSWLPSCSRYDRALTLYFSEILSIQLFIASGYWASTHKYIH